MEKNKITSFEKLCTSTATLGPVGLLPKASGTWASLVTLPFAFLGLKYLPAPLYMLAALLFLGLGIYVSNVYEKTTGTHDSGAIVIDEWVGQWIALTWMPLTWQAILLGFVLFRFFDVLKPPPIRQLDAKVSGGLGVMLDDVAAGLAANVILQLIYTNTSWLGAQLVYVK